MNEDLVRTADNLGRLPLHYPCGFANITNTAQYLFAWGFANTITAKYLYKFLSIRIPDGYGYTVLHTHLDTIYRTDDLKLLEILLDNNQGAHSTPTYMG